MLTVQDLLDYLINLKTNYDLNTLPVITFNYEIGKYEDLDIIRLFNNSELLIE